MGTTTATFNKLPQAEAPQTAWAGWIMSGDDEDRTLRLAGHLGGDVGPEERGRPSVIPRTQDDQLHAQGARLVEYGLRRVARRALQQHALGVDPLGRQRRRGVVDPPPRRAARVTLHRPAGQR